MNPTRLAKLLAIAAGVALFFAAIPAAVFFLVPSSSRSPVAASSPVEIGYEDGYHAGYIAARGGAAKPDSSRLDAMARLAATNAGTPDDDRSFYVHNFKTAFGFGWQEGK
jgi:hypothetical protein